MAKTVYLINFGSTDPGFTKSSAEKSDAVFEVRMKMGFCLALVFFSFSVFAAGQQTLDAKTVNSPVKEHFAKFQFTLPGGTAPDTVWYRFSNPQSTSSQTPNPAYQIDESEHQMKVLQSGAVYEVDVPPKSKLLIVQLRYV